MLNIIIIAVGKLDKPYWKIAALEYFKRLQHDAKVTIHTINESLVSTESEKIRELLKKYDTYQSFLLDINGELVSSEQIAKIVSNNQSFYQGKMLFIIGGSNGVDAQLKQHPKITSLSFGRITLPHQLCQVVLLEQLYRAFQIISNKPYHK